MQALYRYPCLVRVVVVASLFFAASTHSLPEQTEDHGEEQILDRPSAEAAQTKVTTSPNIIHWIFIPSLSVAALLCSCVFIMCIVAKGHEKATGGSKAQAARSKKVSRQERLSKIVLAEVAVQPAEPASPQAASPSNRLRTQAETLENSPALSSMSTAATSVASLESLESPQIDVARDTIPEESYEDLFQSWNEDNV